MCAVAVLLLFSKQKTKKKNLSNSAAAATQPRPDKIHSKIEEVSEREVCV